MLPLLPKQNKTKEAGFGLEFRKWWESNPMIGTFETKHTRGKNTFNLSEFHEEQRIISKLANSKKGVLLRVSSGTNGIPDYIGLVSFPATHLVIKFPKDFYIILTSKLLKLKTLNESTAKSLNLKQP